jgi:hypothetical protein
MLFFKLQNHIVTEYDPPHLVKFTSNLFLKCDVQLNLCLCTISFLSLLRGNIV